MRQLRRFGTQTPVRLPVLPGRDAILRGAVKSRSSRTATATAALALVLVCTSDVPARTQAPAAQAADVRQERVKASVARVFDTSVLHRIEIVIASEDARTILTRTSERVRSTFTFDGIVLKDVGVRQAGGTFNAFVAIDAKPTLSLKFDDFVDGQELHGLEKIIRKDGRQDTGLVGEHLTYEVYRRAGIAAPMTAHAHVTINGMDSGIYVMREAVNRDFLTRNFGRQFSDGNLYELSYRPDPMVSPREIALKDEVEQKRQRTELLGAADAVQTAPPETFAAAVSRYLDLERYITFYAVEAATSNYDGFSFNVNNAYLYAHPRDGRLIMIPYGADSSFWAIARITKIRSPSQTPRAALARRIQSIPELQRKFSAEVARVGRDPVWDKKALHDRLADVGRVLTSAPQTGRAAADVKKFTDYRPVIEAFINNGGTTNSVAGLP
jgi:spore coat protein CotH